MLQAILSAISTCIVNLIVFSIIPFLWWFFRHRKQETFLHWVGIRTPHRQTAWWWLLVFAVFYLILYNFDGEFLFSEQTLTTLNSGDTAISANQYVGLGAAAIIPVFLTTFIANGVAEELLFRGFLCKRLGAKFGTTAGIWIQAVFFGLMHVVLVFASGMSVGLDFYIYELVYTFLGALMLGIANEKLFDGSILPSICLHGAGNCISTLAVIFQWW